MAETNSLPRLVRFGAFEADVQTGELRKDGVKLRFSGHPFQVLAILLERPGDIVTREELQKRIWPDTFVDVERNLNTAINKIREVLGDSAESPKFVETLPRRGYRFIAPVEDAGNGAKTDERSSTDHRRVRKKVPFAFAVPFAVCILAGGGWIAYRVVGPKPPAPSLQRSLTRLTFDEGLQVGVTWSPDGRYIAYASDRGGKFDIWVLQVSGGNPVQLTKGPGQHWQPDWSPDGKYIAYRSEEGDGGIYVAPAFGGAGLERKISSFGYNPRWSPDSSQVLFGMQFTAFGHANRFYVAPLDDSPPHEVLADFIRQKALWARSAAWHPDGKRITIWAGDTSPSPCFWTIPLSGGPAIKLELSPEAQQQLTQASGEVKAGQQWGDYSFAWSPKGDAIYFERGLRGARNIWKLTVDSETLRAPRIERLTTGPGPDAGIAVSPDSRRLAFTAKSQRVQTWLFPFDANTGKIKGEGSAISSPGRPSVAPHLSQDGTKVAYVVPYGESYGITSGDVRNEIWVKSLVDGSEVPVISDDYTRWAPNWSPDGLKMLYDRRNPRTNGRQLMIWSSQSREEEQLPGTSTALGLPMDWSRDGKWLLTWDRNEIWLVPVSPVPREEAGARKVVSNSVYELYQPHISPNDQWIVFEAVVNSPDLDSTLYVTPASGGPWTRITDGRHWDDKPLWSPDGRTIYFVSGQNGFFNIWGIRFDPVVGKTLGQPFQVSRFVSSRLMIPRFIAPVGISLTQDKLAVTVAEESGSIWLLDNIDR